MKKKFTLTVDMSNINDSMELDSGQEIARLEMGNYAATLEVCGYVRVEYKGSVYKAASQMPDELIKIFHDGKCREVEESGDLYIDNNNWLEVFLWEKKGDKLDWTGSSDIVDADFPSAEEIENYLDEYMVECLSNY